MRICEQEKEQKKKEMTRRKETKECPKKNTDAKSNAKGMSNDEERGRYDFLTNKGAHAHKHTKYGVQRC
jgi:hypothetical protein